MAKHTHFTVDGKPFYSLGGQVQNTSGYAPKDLERGLAAVHAVGGNTIAVPVYWELIEPEEGVYDLSSVGEVVQACREEGLKLILLWFGTWKNGTMKYAPPYVKADPDRFCRVINEQGERTAVLSSHCKANFDADKAAFCELMAYLRDLDGVEKTVIAVQVENEPGILGGASRDWSPLGDAAMAEPVPAALIAYIQARGCGPVYDVWQGNGAKEAGNWEAVFGDHACEYMTAWSICHYIDAIAAAGKEIYDILMYVNVWLDHNLWNLPGKCVLSGGAVCRVLDIWKCGTRAIDLIAPDNYKADLETYEEVMDFYTRDDNPFYIPESGNTPSNVLGIFRCVAERASIGNHIFGIEKVIREDGSDEPRMLPITKSLRMLSSVLPLINCYTGTGRIHAMLQNPGMESRRLDLGDWMVLCEFGKDGRPTDYLHVDDRNRPDDPGRGLIFQVGDNEFYLVGDAVRCHFNRKIKRGRIPQLMMSHDQQDASVNYAVCTEGRFDENGRFVVNRHRNGDENDFGIWLSQDVGVVHIQLTD